MWVSLGDYDHVFVARDMICIACEREGGYNNEPISSLRDVLSFAQQVDPSDAEAAAPYASVVFGLLQVLPGDRTQSTLCSLSSLILVDIAPSAYPCLFLYAVGA
jgi:hypothetical protein